MECEDCKRKEEMIKYQRETIKKMFKIIIKQKVLFEKLKGATLHYV